LPNWLTDIAAAALAAVLSLQAHWEVFVGLFDETMTQLEKEIPQETREVRTDSLVWLAF
jgi:hypothetical protein